MKTPSILFLGIASLLLAPFAARAVVETWDGGGANNDFSTGANWADDSAPVSSLANTDLVFGSGPTLMANVDAPFSAHSIGFDNIPGTLAGFNIAGEPLSVGTGGIVNNDSKTSIFTNVVSFAGVANATISATSGALSFNANVILPTGTLTVTGPENTTFKNISGTSALTKTGAGTLTWTPNVAAAFDVTVSAGTLTLGADGQGDMFASGAAIAVNGASVFNIGESLTLDGAVLTRAASADIHLAAGKTLTVQGGGDAVIAGAYIAPSGTTFVITGAGSTFSTTGNLTLGNDTSTTVIAGGSLSTGAASLQIGIFAGSGNVGVDGAGSSVSGGVLSIGQNGFSGSLSLSNGCTGSFSSIFVQDSSTPSAGSALTILSGATLTGTSLNVATMDAATTGSVTIAGAGSALILTGAAAATIGAASGSTATLTVQSGGTFTTGTGLTTVNATGDLNINAGGTMIVRGDMIVHSSLDIANGGTVILSESAMPAPASGELVWDMPALETTVVVVPEPGSATLALLGCALLGLLPRRRKRTEGRN